MIATVSEWDVKMMPVIRTCFSFEASPNGHRIHYVERCRDIKVCKILLQQWTCRNYTNSFWFFSVVIDDSKLKNLKNLTLLAVMGSQFYRWSIKITQLQADKCSQLSTLPPAAAAPVAAMAMTAQRLPNGTDIKESERNNSDPPEYEGNAQATKMKYFSVRQMYV